jgi:hypothetical protein
VTLASYVNRLYITTAIPRESELSVTLVARLLLPPSGQKLCNLENGEVTSRNYALS